MQTQKFKQTGMKKEEKYYFFLNPYKEYAFTKCPKCEAKTRIRKFALVAFFDNPKIIFNINKICRYCLNCELIIAKMEELQPLVETIGQDVKDIFVYGTLSKSDFFETQGKKLRPNEILDRTHPFKDVLIFEMQPAGWYFNKNGQDQIQTN